MAYELDGGVKSVLKFSCIIYTLQILRALLPCPKAHILIINNSALKLR